VLRYAMKRSAGIPEASFDRAVMLLQMATMAMEETTRDPRLRGTRHGERLLNLAVGLRRLHIALGKLGALSPELHEAEGSGLGRSWWKQAVQRLIRLRFGIGFLNNDRLCDFFFCIANGGQALGATAARDQRCYQLLVAADIDSFCPHPQIFA